MYVAGMGDSRVYLIRGKKIEQLTVDHSIAQALVEAKTISAAEARVHRYRNVLWKYLGSAEVGEGPEVKVVPMQAGDRFLLCTDGLSGVVSDEQLLEFMQEQGEPPGVRRRPRSAGARQGVARQRLRASSSRWARARRDLPVSRDAR